MKFSIDKSFKNAIQLDKDSIIDLQKKLESNFSKINITSKLKDSNVTFETFNELLQYRNLTYKKITTLTFHCTSDDKTKTLYLHFGGTNTVVNYSLEYENEAWGFPFERDIDNFLKSFRPPFSFLARINMVFVTFFIVLAPLFTLSFIYHIKRILGLIEPISNGGNTISDSNTFLVFTIILCSILFLIGKPLDMLKNYFVPKIFFAIGEQKKELEKRNRYKTFIFISIIAAFVVSVLAGIAVNSISNN